MQVVAVAVAAEHGAVLVVAVLVVDLVVIRTHATPCGLAALVAR